MVHVDTNVSHLHIFSVGPYYFSTSGNFERTSRVVTGLKKDEVLGGSIVPGAC